MFFTANALDIYLAVHGPSMPREAMDAARRIAAIGDGEDALWKVASDLASDGVAEIGQVAGGAGHWESFAAAFPPVITLDGDSESLSAELQRAVPLIHNSLWHAEPEAVSSGHEGLVLTVVDNFEIHLGGSDDRYVTDPWLEAQSETGEPILREIFDPYDKDDWYRVRRSIFAAAELIEREASRQRTRARQLGDHSSPWYSHCNAQR